jgi:hypothetical protein
MSIRTENVNNFFIMVHYINGVFIISCLTVFSCCWLLVILPIISPIAIPLAILAASGPMAAIFSSIIFEIIGGFYPLILQLSPIILELLSPLIGITVAIAAVAIGLQLLAITIHLISLVIACTLDMLEKPVDGDVDSLSYGASYLNTTQSLRNTSTLRNRTNEILLDNNEQNVSINRTGRPIEFFGSFSQNSVNNTQENLTRVTAYQQA